MKNKEYLAKILPHKEPMILIDDVLEYSIEEKWLKSCVTITEDSMFYDKDINGVDSVVGIEYMAQTIGCYAFLKNPKEKPLIGYLLGTRIYNNSAEKFEAGKTYFILVKEVFAAEIFSFECLIYNENDEEIANATVNVYQEDDEDIKDFVNG
ncbi:3-hydroxylacyl-ACP dehydratase [bacterium]|nr:3-hydroxylacyl-ACP dehydratase [bacterium]